MEPREQWPPLGEQSQPDTAVGVAVHAVGHPRDPVEHHLSGAGLGPTQVEASQTEQRGLRYQNRFFPRLRRMQIGENSIDEVETLGNETGGPAVQVVAPDAAIGGEGDGFVDCVTLGGIRVGEWFGEVDTPAVLGDFQVVADGKRAARLSTIAL